ncbi:Membrane protein OS=Streptomyces microflavus OX=1919 GN=Smic_25340 PE=4 SV=1 [Streptomyces microflavus]
MSEVNGPPGSPGPQSVRTGPQPVGPARQRVGPAPQRIGGWTRFVTARPRLALLAALVITALAVFAGSGVADRMGSGGWQAPDAESSYATEALEREFPASQPNLLLLVESGTASVDDPAVAAEAARLHRAARPQRRGVGPGRLRHEG